MCIHICIYIKLGRLLPIFSLYFRLSDHIHNEFRNKYILFSKMTILIIYEVKRIYIIIIFYKKKTIIGLSSEYLSLPEIILFGF